MPLFFIIAALFLLAPEPAEALPSPTQEFFVNDFAGVLSDETRTEIIAKGKAMDQAAGAQLVVVTVESMGGMSREDFALNLARSWGIGRQDKDNGVLLLVAMRERDVRIEVGSGLEGALPDGMCGRILDGYFIPAMREGDTDTAVLQTYDAILAVAAAEYKLDPQEIMKGTDYSVQSIAAYPEKKASSFLAIFIPLLFGAFFIFIVILAVILQKRHGGSGRGGFGGGSFSGGFRGSGFSGGFRGGGGGGFSGGGAGRKW